MRIYRPVQWIWTFKRWLSYHEDRIKEVIGNICKWIVYSFLLACVAGLLLALLIWNWWATLAVGACIGIIIGWVMWGAGV